MSIRHWAPKGGLYVLAAATPWIPNLLSPDPETPQKQLIAQPEQLTGGAVISEIQFDPVGPDDGTEWVEIAITKGFEGDSLGGYTLEDHLGTPLYAFPDLPRFELGATLVVAFGEERPTWAAENLDGGARWFFSTGAASGNQLADDGGALVLRDPSGAIADYVCWGDAGPPVSTQSYWEALATQRWSQGDCYDISFDGPSPCFPGESIGRNMFAVDTNSAADWGGNGGPDAAGATPGTPNSVDVFTAEGLLFRAQHVVNAAFFGFGVSPQEAHRFSVVSSDVKDVKVTQRPGLAYTVEAQHSFVVQDRTQGVGGGTYAGKLTADFDDVGPRAWRLAVSGALTTPAGESLTVSHAQTVSHGTAGLVSDDQQTELVLTIQGQAYPISTTSQRTERLASSTTVRVDANRTETNWSGSTAHKTSATTTITEHSDKSATIQYELRFPDFTAAYPPLGSSGSGSTLTAVERGTMEATFSGPEDLTLVSKGVQMTLGGAPFASFDSDDPPTIQHRRVSGVVGDPLGSFRTDVRFPYQPQGAPSLQLAEVTETRDVFLQKGKLISRHASTLRMNGTQLGRMDQFVDPPVRQTLNPPPPITSSTTAYGPPHGGNGEGVPGKVVKGAGDVAIIGGCVAWGLKAGVLATPASGVLVGGACALGGVIWGWFW